MYNYILSIIIFFIICPSSGAVEKQKLVYILNRDGQARLTISSPLEAHKGNTLVYHMVGVDVGFENPLFACLEIDYEASLFLKYIFFVIYWNTSQIVIWEPSVRLSQDYLWGESVFEFFFVIWRISSYEIDHEISSWLKYFSNCCLRTLLFACLEIDYEASLLLNFFLSFEEYWLFWDWSWG